MLVIVMNNKNLNILSRLLWFFTPEEISDDSPSFPMTRTTVKKPTARKYLRLLTNIFYVKKRNYIYCIGDANSKLRAIKAGSSL